MFAGAPNSGSHNYRISDSYFKDGTFGDDSDIQVSTEWKDNNNDKTLDEGTLGYTGLDGKSHYKVTATAVGNDWDNAARYTVKDDSGKELGTYHLEKNGSRYEPVRDSGMELKTKEVDDSIVGKNKYVGLEMHDGSFISLPTPSGGADTYGRANVKVLDDDGRPLVVQALSYPEKGKVSVIGKPGNSEDIITTSASDATVKTDKKNADFTDIAARTENGSNDKGDNKSGDKKDDKKWYHKIGDGLSKAAHVVADTAAKVWHALTPW